MKKTFLFIFLLSTGYISAQPLQNKDTLDLICRKWRPDMIADSVLNHMDSAAKEDFKKSMVIFLKDGTYTSYINSAIVERGKWKYMPDSRRLVCKPMDEGDITIIDISSISEEELIGKTFDTIEKRKFSVSLIAIK